MGSDQRMADFVVDQLKEAGTVSSRKMFGEYAVYLDGKVVALICDNQVFVKPTPGGRAFAGPLPEAPPYPGGKPCLLLGEQIEDSAWFSQLVRITAQELPPPKPKKKKRQN